MVKLGIVKLYCFWNYGNNLEEYYIAQNFKMVKLGMILLLEH